MNLTAADLAALERSYITREIAEQAGVYRVDSREGGIIISKNGTGNWSGLVFPFYHPEEGEPRLRRLRLDNPTHEVDQAGNFKQSGKYRSPYGARNHFYFPPGILKSDLADPSLPVVFVEGEKKALAMLRLAREGAAEGQLRLLPIGLIGVWGWKGTTGKDFDERGARVDVKGPLPDFDEVDWNHRRATVFFDSNASDNPSVQAAQRHLCLELARRGAIPHMAVTPSVDGVNGPDDLLYKWGPERVNRLIDDAPRLGAQGTQAAVAGAKGSPIDNPALLSWMVQTNPKDWKLWDFGQARSWVVEPLEWVVSELLPKGGMGFLCSAPKTGKSLILADLLVHIAHAGIDGARRPWLGRYQVEPVKVLYLAREDPARRVQERVLEINDSYGLPDMPEGRVCSLILEQFSLTEPEHLEWLAAQVRGHGFELVILDVLNRMIPGTDEQDSADMSKVVRLLEGINRTLKITMVLVDHTRKPPAGPGTRRDNQEPSPFDLKGSVAKYGCADFMWCLARTPQPGRLQMYVENKDSDRRPTFFIDVSPIGKLDELGQPVPKFTYGGDVETLRDGAKELGDRNRSDVLKALEADGGWCSTEDLAAQTNLAKRTVQTHLKSLIESGMVESTGNARSTRFRVCGDSND